jgi:hypothetical protein
VQLHAEEVHPDIPLDGDPQETFAHADERRRLRNGVQREVVQLHAVVVAQRPHEATRRRRESALVEADETDDVAERRVGLPLVQLRHDPHRGAPILVRRELTGGYQVAQGKPRHC